MHKSQDGGTVVNSQEPEGHAGGAIEGEMNRSSGGETLREEKLNRNTASSLEPSTFQG